MAQVRIYSCEVCDVERCGGQWLLVLPDYAHHTLKIARWNSVVARRPEVRHVCSLQHARELVSHWMTMGNLDFPSPEGPPVVYSSSQRQAFVPTDSRGWLRLGQLMVDPNSLAGLQGEPGMLMSVLDAIDVALQPCSDDEDSDDAEMEQLTHSSFTFDA